MTADYQAGLDAFSLGDYTTAMTEWRAVTDGPATAANPAIYVEAHYAVAMLYWQGQGVPQDYGKAKEWLLKAARMNHAGAQAKLGYMYTDGVTVPQDYDLALEWFQKAARGGNVDGLYNLGIFYLYGWGVEQDTTMAAQYLAAASAQGDPEAEEALQQVLAQVENGRPTRVPALETLPEPERALPPAASDAISDEAPVGARLARDSDSGSADAAVSPDAGAADDRSRAKRAPTASVQSDLGQAQAETAQTQSDLGQAQAETAQTQSDAGQARAEAAQTQADTGEMQADTGQGQEHAEPALLDEAWIRAQDPQHYTIQVMALRSRDKVQEFMDDYAAFAPFAVFTVQKGTAPLHVMLQGSYPDVESARAAKAGFPREIQRQDALWIRKFGMVQRLLE